MDTAPIPSALADVDWLPVSDDSIAYGVEEFLFGRNLSQGTAALERHSPVPLPSLAEFTIKDAGHVVALALRGHRILPTGKEEIFESVAEGGSFTMTVEDRLASLQEERQACQREPSRASMLRLQEIDREEKDWRRYMRSERTARADRFAKEYGCSDVGELYRYIGTLDATAARLHAASAPDQVGPADADAAVGAGPRSMRRAEGHGSAGKSVPLPGSPRERRHATAA